jgi:iron complex outermembrane recepter protein
MSFCKPATNLLAHAACATACATAFATTCAVFSQHSAAQSPIQTTLPTVSVTAPKSNNDSSLLPGINAFESPMSVNSLSAEQLRIQGVNSLSTVIKNDAAASDSYNTLGYIESLSLRGFLLDNRFNYRRDGLPVSNHVPLVMENKQRIEILKGTSGSMAGVSAPGGLVNWVVKRPTDTTITQVNAEVSERGSTLLSVDLGGRVAQDRFGYRINASVGKRKPFADNAPGDKQFLSGYVDWRANDTHSVAIESEILRSKQISVPGFALLDSNRDGVGDQLPAVPSSKVNLNNQTWALPFVSASQTGSVRYLFTGTDQFRAGVRLGWQRIKTQDRIAFPDGCSSDTTYVYPGICANGDVDVYDFRSNNEKRNTRSGDAYASGQWIAGITKHQWRLGFLSSTYQETFEPKQAYNFVGTSNIYAPISLPSDQSANDLNTNSQVKTQELSFSDAITLGQWQAWLGLRHTRLAAQSARTDGSRSVNYSQSFTTPWGALSYRLAADQLIYLSIGKGIETEFVPNRPKLFSNYGQALPTLVSQQWEFGWRQKFQQGSVHAALFSIRKPFSGDLLGSEGSEQATRVAGARVARHRGVEMAWQQSLNSQWDIDANLALLDARQIKTADDTDVNKRTVNVSPVQARINALWKLAPQWSLLNSVSFRSSKPVTRDNSVSLPSAAQWDSLISWTIQDTATQVWTARVGISNVLNTAYWKDAPTQPWGGIYLFAAEPRALRVLISTRF